MKKHSLVIALFLALALPVFPQTVSPKSGGTDSSKLPLAGGTLIGPVTLSGGTSGNSNLPFFKIVGGGDTPTSIQLLLRNTRDGAGYQGNDYENEVHLRLQAGTTTEHRSYINFADRNGTDIWLTGKNASKHWILYNSTDGHRIVMEPTDGTAPGNTGNTYLNSGGSGSVQINNGNNDGDTLGTGGFEVFGGAAYPRTSLFKVSTLTDTSPILQSYSNGGGYAPASLLLKAGNSTSRGQGIFHYNVPAQTSWFTGIAYAQVSSKWVVNYESNASFDPAVASIDRAKLIVGSDGVVGVASAFYVGNGTPASRIGNAPLQGQNIILLTGVESLTIAASATTDTSMTIPAGAIVLSVNVLVKTVIPTAATFTVTGATSGTTFNTAAVAVAANTTDVGTAAGAYYNGTAQKIRITPNLTPGAATGVLRISVVYLVVTPATS